MLRWRSPEGITSLPKRCGRLISERLKLVKIMFVQIKIKIIFEHIVIFNSMYGIVNMF